MPLFNFVSVVVVSLIAVTQVIAEERFVEFDSYYYSSESQHSVAIISSSKEYQLELSEERFTIKDNVTQGVFNKYPAQKLKTVNCPLFISFNERPDVGIYTCQDDDNECFVVPLPGIQQNKPRYFSWRALVKVL